MYMSFKEFYKRSLNEKANFTLDGIGMFYYEGGNLVGLYNASDDFIENYERMTIDDDDEAADFISNNILGVMTLLPISKENAMEVGKVVSKEKAKRGPLLYLVGMYIAQKKYNASGLMPNHDVDMVQPRAKNVWANFYEEAKTEDSRVAMTPLSKNYHDAKTLNYLNFKYTIQNAELISNIEACEERSEDLYEIDYQELGRMMEMLVDDTMDKIY
jgi:hypothetical protein